MEGAIIERPLLFVECINVKTRVLNTLDLVPSVPLANVSTDHRRVVINPEPYY